MVADSGLLIAVVFGLIFGSFLNVVILRFDDWLAIVKTPSHCPNCKHRLSWLDLVPVFSFLFLGGKCRYCHKPISWQYPIVELLTAVLLAIGYRLIFVGSDLNLLSQSAAAISYVVIIVSVITIAFHDYYEMMVPDLMANIFIAAAIIFSLSFQRSPISTVEGGVVGFLPIALLVYPSRGKWMGEGDIKISTAIGLMLGWPLAIVGLALAFLGGGGFGLLALALKKVKLRSAVPFGPFLIIAGLVTLFYGQVILDWYLNYIGYGF
jgi:leader peptidase (prepilin peptidase)/N-methyltransferase